MTLISVYDSEGCVGSCDARCYDAKHPLCDCVCGGRNHAKGERAAIANTAEHAEQWAREYEARRGMTLRFGLGVAVEQTNLFE
ncbi:MAG: hypothetical protein ABSC23_03930 [Bryobacteraceae bacterium]